VELVVLGAGGGWAGPGGATAGYLLRAEGFHLWVDLGSGTMARLQEHAALEDVRAVVVSHRHFDHFVDLYPFWLSLWYGGGRPRIPLFAPPGMFEHAAQLHPDIAQAYEVRPVEPGGEFEVGPFRVRTAPMQHPVPTLGMRFEAEGRSLCYSADTGPTDALVSLAKGADLLLAEATWLERPPGAEPIHLTAREAGEAGRRAGVGRLVLTHVWATNPRDVVRARASEAFGADVTVATEGLTVRV
jgi:ribonuclease BN (tRNA processing enzyme)